MLKELTNGNYYIYQVEEGGCGIVKADDYDKAAGKVIKAYELHGERDINVEVFKIKDGWFDDSPDVIELGWSIELN